MSQNPRPETPAQRMARVGIGATAGLVVGTAVNVATSQPVAPAAGAAIGAVVAVIINQRHRRR